MLPCSLPACTQVHALVRINLAFLVFQLAVCLETRNVVVFNIKRFGFRLLRGVHEAISCWFLQAKRSAADAGSLSRQNAHSSQVDAELTLAFFVFSMAQLKLVQRKEGGPL
ncbi:protein of unknown function [Agrobacterium pusense]|uniref:Uncharacterized protein n=1 Tax=Agrobacterium pusense TaxID=648995 RepID=U4PSL7_9HYPH|nr:protein of unknown function [Agrobacterium pusense]